MAPIFNDGGSLSGGGFRSANKIKIGKRTILYSIFIVLLLAAAGLFAYQNFGLFKADSNGGIQTKAWTGGTFADLRLTSGLSYDAATQTLKLKSGATSGTATAIFDSGTKDTTWNKLSWSWMATDTTSSISGRLKASNTTQGLDSAIWSKSVIVSGGQTFLPSGQTYPKGQYATIEYTVSNNTGATSLNPVSDISYVLAATANSLTCPSGSYSKNSQVLGKYFGVGSKVKLGTVTPDPVRYHKNGVLCDSDDIPGIYLSIKQPGTGVESHIGMSWSNSRNAAGGYSENDTQKSYRPAIRDANNLGSGAMIAPDEAKYTWSPGDVIFMDLWVVRDGVVHFKVTDAVENPTKKFEIDLGAPGLLKDQTHEIKIVTAIDQYRIGGQPVQPTNTKLIGMDWWERHVTDLAGNQIAVNNNSEQEISCSRGNVTIRNNDNTTSRETIDITGNPNAGVGSSICMPRTPDGNQPPLLQASPIIFGLYASYTKQSTPPPAGVTVPTLTINDPVKYKNNAVNFYGNITSNGGSAVAAQGFAYRKQSELNERLITSLVIDPYGNISGRLVLSDPGVYIARSYADNAAGRGYSSYKRFEITDESSVVIPTVKTLDPSDINHWSILPHGKVENAGGGAIIKRGFEYAVIDQATASDTFDANENGMVIGEFVKNPYIPGLEASTVYRIRAYAVNSAGTGYGEWKEFTTLSNPVTAPVVQTLPAIKITSNSLVPQATIVSNTGWGISERGFQYGLSTTSYDVHRESGNFGTGVIFGAEPARYGGDPNLFGLEPASDYYVRAFAKNNMGTGYGEWIKVRTKDKSLPIVKTDGATHITKISFVPNGNILSNGGSKLSEVGFQYRKVKRGDTKKSYDLTPLGYPAGPFTKSPSIRLKYKNTEYEYRAYAKNEIGTGYGEWVKLKTLK